MPDEILTLREAAQLLKIAQKPSTLWPRRVSCRRSRCAVGSVSNATTWNPGSKQQKRPFGGNDLAALLSDRVLRALDTAGNSYHRLVLAVGPARSGKTEALIDLAEANEWPWLNVNLELAEQLLELTQKQRAVRVAAILGDIVRGRVSTVVLLDNIEMLFAVDLAQDPLRLLQGLSRNRAIIAAWPGQFDGNALTYGEPGHPEARRYLAPQAVIITAGETGHPKVAEPRGGTA